MHSALFQTLIDEITGTDFDQNKALDVFLRDATTQCKQGASIETLGKGVWLIPLESDLPFLGLTTHLASTYGIPYRVLFLNERPVWVRPELPSQNLSNR